MHSTLPRYRRETIDVSLVESFTGLAVTSAPRYEASPAYETITSSPSDAGQHKEAARIDRPRPRSRKYLALRAAECYFAEIMRRDRRCDIKRAVEHYKEDLETCAIYRALHGESTDNTNINHLFLRGRGKGLRHWVNLAIEHVVMPELQRREHEEKKIWRAEQKWMNETRQANKLQEAYSSRLRNIATTEAEKFRIFGDIGTGVRTAGKEVAEIGHQGERASTIRARRISDLLADRDDDMLFECKRLQKVCVERMQSCWKVLLEHCNVQIELVKARAVEFNRAKSVSSREAASRARIMEALMLHEVVHMEVALFELIATFSRSIMEKTQEYPPIVSFYQTFGPLTGSALRAAREVTISNGILYDNSFLRQNKLDLYAADFYDAMKDHLTMLMVQANLQDHHWKNQRAALARIRTC